MTLQKCFRQGSLWVLAGWAAWSLPGYVAGAQMAPPASSAVATGAEALATVAGTSVEMSGAPVAFNAQGRLQIFAGARLQVERASSAAAGTAGAQLDLTRGGTMRLCGPARVDLAGGGGGALLIALDAGGVALRYASAVSDSLLTPDFRVTTVVPPQQMATVSANAGLEADGTLCLTNHGSALAVQNLWTGAQRFVIGGDSWEFHPGGATTAVAACPCASPEPAAVTTPADAEGALFPSSPALAVQAHGANGGSAASPAAANPPAPGRAHHNVFVRFFRWLAGKN